MTDEIVLEKTIEEIIQRAMSAKKNLLERIPDLEDRLREEVQKRLKDLKELEVGDYVFLEKVSDPKDPLQFTFASFPEHHCGEVVNLTSDGIGLRDRPTIPYSSLEGVYINHPVPGWNFEDRSKLHVVQKARVSVPSGLLKIIEPGFTKEYGAVCPDGLEIIEPSFLKLFAPKKGTHDPDCKRWSETENYKEWTRIIQGEKVAYLHAYFGCPYGSFSASSTKKEIDILLESHEEHQSRVASREGRFLWPKRISARRGTILIGDAKATTTLECMKEFRKDYHYKVEPGTYSVSLDDNHPQVHIRKEE